MDFGYDTRTEELRARLAAFLDEFVYPAEAVFDEQREQAVGDARWSAPPVVEDLKAEAGRQGLWNLFLPGEHGAELTNLQYAPLAELTGRSPHLAPPALNCAAPDTGNMEVLAEFGTPAQRKEWLEPLLAGEIRSAFAMTEPDVASSDATNIETRIARDGDSYVINGRKWYISGAMNPKCAVFIVMGKTDPAADRHRQQSQILVPRDTPGLEVRRGMRVFGYDDGDHGGHGEVVFHDVRVPVANLVGEEGGGFAIAQARLGPGRIHHCMRLIGMAERALELMCRMGGRAGRLRQAAGRAGRRAGVDRRNAGGDRAVAAARAQDGLADGHGGESGGAHGDPGDQDRHAGRGPADRRPGDPLHGAGGVSQDTPLAQLWAAARTLRLADGPDEVHKRSLARRELRKYV